MPTSEKSEKNVVICICPKCRKRYKLGIFWTGIGTPRIYCHNCRFHSIINESSYEEPHSIRLTI